MRENRSQTNLSPEDLRILRAHWEWAGRHAMYSIVIGLLIMGGAFAIFKPVTRTWPRIMIVCGQNTSIEQERACKAISGSPSAAHSGEWRAIGA